MGKGCPSASGVGESGNLSLVIAVDKGISFGLGFQRLQRTLDGLVIRDGVTGEGVEVATHNARQVIQTVIQIL